MKQKNSEGGSYQSFPEPLLQIKTDSEIIDASTAGSELLGFSREELVGRFLSDFLPEKSLPYQFQKRSCSPHVDLLTLQNRDGAPLQMRTLFFYLENDKILLIFCRHQEELDETRENEAFFRTLVENSDDGLAVIDEQGRVVYQNPTMAKALGYERGEAVGKNGFDFVHPDDLEQVYGAFRRLLSGAEKQVVEEYRVIAADGTVEYYESIARLPENKMFPGAIVSSREVTHRRKLEEKLRAAHKMEAVGRLAGGIAHDFNNLLTVISASSDFLLQSLSEDDERYEDVIHIQRASDRAASLTRQLLAFSRRQILKQEILDVNATLEEAMRMIRRLIGENIQIELELDPHTRLIRADRAQMEQVLFNLVVNSRDAMPDGGILTISTGNAFLDSNTFKEEFEVKAGEYVSISVRDNGAGISDEVQQHVFEPFFTTKEAGKGTGLGLSTVYGIVKQSDGYIIVESQPGEGSTFRIFLPVAMETPSTDFADSVQEDFRGGETVLLVEDEENVRLGMKRVLEQFGYRVLDATDGEEALRIASEASKDISLLVIDVVLPGMNGKQVAEKIKLLIPEVTILFCSGYTDDTIVRHGVLDSHLHFLQKPFAPLELARKVRQVLDTAVSPSCG